MIRLKPNVSALEFLQSVGWSEPGDLSLEEMVYSFGGVVKEVPMNGAEGRILMHRDTAVISISNSITHTGKRNFVLAHELGHFILHKGLVPVFSDTEKTLSDWHRVGPHEAEANEFASELLMPSVLFQKKVIGRQLSLGLIKEVASHFGVSITAAFLKYQRLGDFPLMVVYLEDGVVKWKQCSKDFPFQYLPVGSKVSAYTVAGDYFLKGNAEVEPEKVDAIEWFPEDRIMKYKNDWKLWEQCFPVSDNGIIACIWTY